MRAVFDDLYSIKAPSSSVFDGSLAGNGGSETSRATFSQPSRHFGRVGSLSLWHSANFESARTIFTARPVRSLSLWRGANFEIPRATFSALWACQIALVVARCSFLWSRISCAEILTRRSLQESLRRDLATETSYKDLVQRALVEILYRDIA